MADQKVDTAAARLREIARKGVRSTQEALIYYSTQLEAILEADDGPIGVDLSNASCRVMDGMMDMVRVQNRYGQQMIGGDREVLTLPKRKEQDAAVLRALALAKLTHQERMALGLEAG